MMLSLPPLFPVSPHPSNPADNQAGAINLMLMTQERFKGFLPRSADHRREMADVRKMTQALFCLSLGERGEVDAWVERAVRAGGRGDVCKSEEGEGKGKEGSKEEKEGGNEKVEGEEVMYGRSFEDLDGHIWELVWMNPNMSAQEISASGEKGMEKE